MSDCFRGTEVRPRLGQVRGRPQVLTSTTSVPPPAIKAFEAAAATTRSARPWDNGVPAHCPVRRSYTKAVSPPTTGVSSQYWGGPCHPAKITRSPTVAVAAPAHGSSTIQKDLLQKCVLRSISLCAQDTRGGWVRPQLAKNSAHWRWQRGWSIGSTSTARGGHLHGPGRRPPISEAYRRSAG